MQLLSELQEGNHVKVLLRFKGIFRNFWDVSLLSSCAFISGRISDHLSLHMKLENHSADLHEMSSDLALLAACLIGILFSPEEWGNMFDGYVGWLSADYILLLMLHTTYSFKTNCVPFFHSIFESATFSACDLVVRVPGYRFPTLPDFLERGPLSLVSTIEELLGRKSSGSGLEIREYGLRDPLRWPRGTKYPQQLALTSPTSGCHSIGIVISQTQATEFSFLFFFSFECAVNF
jgi:hypothetical protein